MKDCINFKFINNHLRPNSRARHRPATSHHMNTAHSGLGLLLGVLALAPAQPAHASFTSLHVFGDGVCTTTDNAFGPPLYHGNRYSNGRVWVEVLAQWQGLAYVPSANLSYYGHDSGELLQNLAAFTPPADAATALFALWSANADFVEFTLDVLPPPYDAGDLPAWAAFTGQAVARHQQAVDLLYQKGARTLVVFNAADIAATPVYHQMDASSKQFIRQRTVEFNLAFKAALAGREAALPGLRIHQPDAFALFDQVLSNPAAFGLTHQPGQYGLLLVNPGDPDLLRTGPGTECVFWDDLHPTGRFQVHLAALVQRMISPARLTRIAFAGADVQLDLAGIPLGLQGHVDGSSTPGSGWLPEASVLEPAPGGSTTTSVTLPAAGSRRFFRLRFPVAWSWP